LKKIAAILLIGVLFFNWYGYQLLSSYWQQLADRRMEAALDNHEFNDSELLSIKVPIRTLSYYNSSLDFERVDGQIIIGHMSYKYVKRRILKDSLELLCIPNLWATRLRTARDDFFRQVNDLNPETDHGQHPASNTSHHKGFQKDFSPGTISYTLEWPTGTTSSAIRALPSPSLPAGYTPTTERPPDLS